MTIEEYETISSYLSIKKLAIGDFPPIKANLFINIFVSKLKVETIRMHQ